MIKKRIVEILELKGISKENFYKKIGMTSANFRGSAKSRPLNSNAIEKILAEIPDINTEWLLTGEGKMLKADRADNTVAYGINGNELLYKPQSKAIERFWNEQEVPLYELDAAAGLQTIFSNQQQNIISFIKIPDLPRCDGAIYIRGDSMYPLLKSGDIVIFKEVRDFRYLSYGEMYLIDYLLDNDDHLVVKFIQDSEIEGHIKLVSHNTYHKPKDIPVSSIRAIAIVKASVRLNTMK
ncbi:MAG: S24 family peptidase [Bacteroidales bacterium]|jgi:phage repressor protein C with HTH and peptisase S24 domain|nr:S24 family peptidase [Bacteroidales bacterium]